MMKTEKLSWAFLILYLTFSTFEISGNFPSKSNPELQAVSEKVDEYIEKFNIKPEYKTLSISYSEEIPYSVYARCSVSLFNKYNRHITFNISYRYLLKDNPKAALVIILHEKLHCECNYSKHDEKSLIMSAELDERLINTYSQEYLDLLINDAILTYCPHDWRIK